jgi:hypothetical protein
LLHNLKETLRDIVSKGAKRCVSWCIRTESSVTSSCESCAAVELSWVVPVVCWVAGTKLPSPAELWESKTMPEDWYAGPVADSCELSRSVFCVCDSAEAGWVGASCEKRSYSLGSKLSPRSTWMRGDGRLVGVLASTGVVKALDAKGRLSSTAGVDGCDRALSVCAVDGSGLLCTTRAWRLGRGCFVGFFDCFLPLLLSGVPLTLALAAGGRSCCQDSMSALVQFATGSQVGSYSCLVAGSLPFHWTRYCSFPFLRRSSRMPSASHRARGGSLCLGRLLCLGGFVEAFRFGIAATRRDRCEKCEGCAYEPLFARAIASGTRAARRRDGDRGGTIRAGAVTVHAQPMNATVTRAQVRLPRHPRDAGREGHQVKLHRLRMDVV